MIRPCDITDVKKKIAYRKERIAHLEADVKQRFDAIEIMNDEITELEKLLE